MFASFLVFSVCVLVPVLFVFAGMLFSRVAFAILESTWSSQTMER